MSALTDADMQTRYVRPSPRCLHVDTQTEYKLHLNEIVCICGARRRCDGADQEWKRTRTARDQLDHPRTTRQSQP